MKYQSMQCEKKMHTFIQCKYMGTISTYIITVKIVLSRKAWIGNYPGTIDEIFKTVLCHQFHHTSTQRNYAFLNIKAIC